MRAVVVQQPGGPEQLVVAHVPDPIPEPGEVLLEVTAAGVNRADLLQRQGLYPPPTGASQILGLECSGTVVQSDSSEWPVGAPACALLTGGGYAERVAVPAGQLLPIPDAVGAIAAATLPEVACTVLSNLGSAPGVGLKSGEWLLVHGGAGGIGTFAIQWARALGAHVAVTAGSMEKLQRCAGLGAEVLINYREQDFTEQVLSATDGHGADVILDLMGASYLKANVRALALDGRLVVIGLQGGTRGELDLGRLLTKRASVTATSLRARPLDQKARIVDSVLAQVWPLVESGAIRTVVERTLPLDEAAEAHRIMAASEHVGKLVLTP